MTKFEVVKLLAKAVIAIAVAVFLLRAVRYFQTISERRPPP